MTLYDDSVKHVLQEDNEIKTYRVPHGPVLASNLEILADDELSGRPWKYAKQFSFHYIKK